jgi:hypothetical protein
VLVFDTIRTFRLYDEQTCAITASHLRHNLWVTTEMLELKMFASKALHRLSAISMQVGTPALSHVSYSHTRFGGSAGMVGTENN